MIFKINCNLKKYNTFGIKATCTVFTEIETVKNLKEVLKRNTLPIQILGGGSNMLFTQTHYDWFFIKNSIKGIKIVGNTEGGKNHQITKSPNHTIIQIGGGENWHSCVLYTIKNNLGGIENLSLIPGTVGASPIQNIGAYGVELKDVFVKLEALNLQTLEIETFTYDDCQFGYRDSVFKKDLKGKYFITKVFLKLTDLNDETNAKNYKPKTDYGDIQKILSERHIITPTIKDVSEAVISIRQSKLPDPSVSGNAGSFFKNPTLEKTDCERLLKQFPNMPNYPALNFQVKLAAGWLIEQCGWKGKRIGNVGVHEQQALVLVNYGKGKGLEIKELATQIKQSVLNKFGVELQAEVNIV